MIASLAGFLMGFIGSMPIAGPVSLLVFHRGLLGRYSDAWVIGLGGALVEGIYCALAIQGFTVVGTSLLEPVAKGVGVLLPLALGLYFIRVSEKNPKENPVPEPCESNSLRAFSVGLSAAALNPALILTWSASVALLHSVTGLTFSTYQRMGFAASVALGIIAWFSVLLALLRQFRERLASTVHQVAIRTFGRALVIISMLSLARLAV